MKKIMLAAALVMGSFVAFGGSDAQAGCGYGGYGGYGYGYGYSYGFAPVYRPVHVHYAPIYRIPAYSYGCYGW